MRELVARFAVVAQGLPDPPGVEPEDQDGRGLLVFAAVVVILGLVVLTAWLLKPLVARRLAAMAEAAEGEAEDEPASGWEDSWLRLDQETEARREVKLSETRASGGELVGEDPLEPPPVSVDATPAIEEDVQQTSLSPEAIVGITLTVRELLDAANAGQLLRGLALYSADYLRRFRGELGLSDEEFAERFADVPPPPPETHAALAAVSDVEPLPDGRVTATIHYANGAAAPPPERFTFVRSATGDRWLIDDISTIG